MIISPTKMKCVVEIGQYHQQTHTTIWRTGEFSVDELPKTDSDGTITLDPSTLLGCWDEWETTIPPELRSWDFDRQSIENEDFKKHYKILHYKIVNGYKY
jgi:hypothetical protein